MYDHARRFVFVLSQCLELQWDGLVDYLEVAAARQLLEFDQGEVGLDAGGVAVHHQPDRAGGGDHRDLGVAEAMFLSERQGAIPGPSRRRNERGVGAVGRVERDWRDGKPGGGGVFAVGSAAVIAD